MFIILQTVHNANNKTGKIYFIQLHVESPQARVDIMAVVYTGLSNPCLLGMSHNVCTNNILVLLKNIVSLEHNLLKKIYLIPSVVVFRKPQFEACCCILLMIVILFMYLKLLIILIVSI
jgi:hypothetical protein